MLNLDSDTVWWMLGSIVVAGGIFVAGHWVGGNAVLDAERLAAQNETLYRLVTVNNTAPSSDLMGSASEVCAGEDRSSKDTCMRNFLNDYGEVWVVNLIDGTRERLATGPVQ